VDKGNWDSWPVGQQQAGTLSFLSAVIHILLNVCDGIDGSGERANWLPAGTVSGQLCIVIRRLTTGIRSEKCAVRQFGRCANVIQCTYTNPDSTAGMSNRGSPEGHMGHICVVVVPRLAVTTMGSERSTSFE
jgi:hypothetical protein